MDETSVANFFVENDKGNVTFHLNMVHNTSALAVAAYSHGSEYLLALAHNDHISVWMQLGHRYEEVAHIPSYQNLTSPVSLQVNDEFLSVASGSEVSFFRTYSSLPLLQ